MQRDYSNLLKLLAVIWLIIGLVVLSLFVLIQLADVLLVFILAALIATAFGPTVRRLQLAIPKMPRIVAVLIVYLVGLSVIGGMFTALAFPLISQTQELAKQVPELARNAPQALPLLENFFKGFGINVDTSGLVSKFNSQIQAVSETILRGLASGLVTLTSAVGQAVIAVVVSIYLLLSASKMRARFLDAVPQDHKEESEALLNRFIKIAAGFIRGQLILAVSIGIPVGLFALALGLPYSALIGLFSGLAEFIPVVGSILGAIPAILIGLIFGGPKIALILVVFFIILNQVESNIIAPRVVGQELGLHPITTIFALLIGFKYFGIWGAVFAAPATAALWAIWLAAYRVWTRASVAETASAAIHQGAAEHPAFAEGAQSEGHAPQADEQAPGETKESDPEEGSGAQDADDSRKN